MKVPEITWKYMKVHENTWKYLKVPESTWKYLQVPESAWNYLKVLSLSRSLPTNLDSIENTEVTPPRNHRYPVHGEEIRWESSYHNPVPFLGEAP